MPISTISTIYVNTNDICGSSIDRKFNGSDSYQPIKPKRRLTDFTFVLLLFPSLLILAILIDTMLQTGWSENIIIDYCIVGLSIMFLGTIVLSICYFTIGLSKRFKQSSNDQESINNNCTNSQQIPNELQIAPPPNYSTAAEDMLPPTYESIVTSPTKQNQNQSREFTAITMYI